MFGWRYTTVSGHLEVYCGSSSSASHAGSSHTARPLIHSPGSPGNLYGAFDVALFEGVSSGLLDEGDLEDAASVIAPGTSAGILIFENRWATRFVSALPRRRRRAGGRGLHPTRGRRRGTRRDRDLDQDRKDFLMPGLLRGIARTAVIAGTATAVSNRVSRRQANRWAQQDDQQYAQQPQYRQAASAPATGCPVAYSCHPAGANLKSQGILTDAEFESQKAKILAST